tara:strand:- start:1803 stop:3437 length:1635 start_codon:yes stop_codon:yes gene_type:complete
MIKDKDKFEGEIDLLKLFLLLKRRKKIVFIFGIFSIILGLIRAFTVPRTWQGEFQIVANNSSTSSAVSNISIPFSPFNSKFQSSDLKTDIEILKSPSVLLSIYEFVKEKKNLKGMRFDTWKKSININLQGGTKVLTLEYRDQEKDLILPVLNKISRTYQNYSGKRREREIEINTKFYRMQIPNLRKKYNASIYDATKFAAKYDLGIDNSTESNGNLFTPISIENERVEESNKLRLIDEKIKNLSNEEITFDKIKYFAEVTEKFPSISQYILQIQNLDNKINVANNIYTSNEIALKSLEAERLRNFKTLKKNLRGILEAKKTEAINKIEASKRPPEVLAKYQQLISEIKINRLALNKMELDYQNLLIEKEREKDPWELITKPSLLPYPVAPNKKVLILTIFSIGLFLSFLTAFIKEFYENIIFSINEVEILLSTELIGEIPIKSDFQRKEYIELFSKNYLENIKGNIAIFHIGDIPPLTINSIKDDFENILKNKIFLTSNLLKAYDKDKIIIMTSSGNIKKNEINELNKKLILKKDSVLGLINLV